MEKIKVVMLEPGEAAYAAEIDNDLGSMQKAVGGYIQAVYPFVEQVCIVCNEEGKLMGLPLNRALYDEDGDIYDIIAGDAFLCDCSGENFGSLTDAQIEHYISLYHFPECFVRIDDRIIAIKQV